MIPAPSWPRALRGAGWSTVREGLERGLGHLVDARRTPASIAFLGATVVNECASLLGWKPGVYASKPLLVPILAAHTLQRARGWATNDKVLLAASAALHTIGDLALLRDTTGSRPEDMLGGELGFGAGHLVGMVLQRRLGLRPTVWTLGISTATGGFFYTLRRLTSPTSQTHDLVFGAYAAVVMEYALRNISALWAEGWDREAAICAALGGAEWIVSDSLIVVRLYLADRPLLSRILSMQVMDTYCGAQALVLSGLARQLTRNAGHDPDA